MLTMRAANRHFLALDCVRGLAAAAVLLFHLGRWLDVKWLQLNAELSIDVFFTLSGFVLTWAYASRAEQISLMQFIILRLIRLMPMIILATSLSATYVVFRGITSRSSLPVEPVIIAWALGSLNLPYFNAPALIGGPQVFPLNGPQYSLFFEMACNVIWWIGRFRNGLYFTLIAFILYGCALCIFDVGGDKTDDFPKGLAHVGSSFTIGIFVFRLHMHTSTRKFNKLSPLVLQPIFYAAVLLVIIIMYAPISESFTFTLLSKLILSPILVYAGANVLLPERLVLFARISGEISYPIYILHYPVFCWCNGFYQWICGSRNYSIEIPLIFFVVMISSFCALYLFDEPLRRYLAEALHLSNKSHDPTIGPNKLKPLQAKS